MTRAEKVKRAQVLRAEGLLMREIAKRMGVATTTVDNWLNDPDRAKQCARRERYSRPCVDCGAPTDGSGGYAVSCQRCNNCRLAYQHEHRYWTPERVVEELQAWADELGRPLVASDGLRGGARVPCSTVQREFGSWSAGLHAAGLPRVPPGPKPKVRVA